MKINFQNKVIWKVISILMITSMLTVFNQCVVQEFDVNDSSKIDDVVDDIEDVVDVPVGGSGEFTETGATEVARTITSVGIKDFEEVYYTMSIVTGIDPQNEGSIRNLYRDLMTQLPYDASIKLYTTANQIAIIKLGSEYCHQLFNKSQYYNSFFNNFNISEDPNEVLMNETDKQILIGEFISKFWGVNTQPDILILDTRDEMSLLIDDLLVGENLNSSGTTRKVAKGICTSMIASAPLVLL